MSQCMQCCRQLCVEIAFPEAQSVVTYPHNTGPLHRVGFFVVIGNPACGGEDNDTAPTHGPGLPQSRRLALCRGKGEGYPQRPPDMGHECLDKFRFFSYNFV